MKEQWDKLKEVIELDISIQNDLTKESGKQTPPSFWRAKQDEFVLEVMRRLEKENHSQS
jgi:hypothetical protein